MFNLSGNRSLISQPEFRQETQTDLFLRTRQQTENLCADLSPEDCQVQSATQCSPIKWHLAHVSWFFQHFILNQAEDNPDWHHLFNSYYHTVGQMNPRDRRGLITRPSLTEVYAYRRHIDEQMVALLERVRDDQRLLYLTRLGIEHERQHQELILMDIKHHLFANPTYPAYTQRARSVVYDRLPELVFRSVDPQLVHIGRSKTPAQLLSEDFCHPDNFCYDNETNRHKVWLAPFALANRLISNGEYLEFMNDGGYQRVELWLSDGWDCLQTHQTSCPLYWVKKEGHWQNFTLRGLSPLALHQPVSHLSYYEACAYAQWTGKRLPNEYELEWMMLAERDERSPDAVKRTEANFLESQRLEPVIDDNLSGNLWQWTSSPYRPYPGFKPLNGSLSEYNAKFMANQNVLRGGSYATPSQHFRPSYRNYYYPHERWGFTGLRLASDG